MPSRRAKNRQADDGKSRDNSNSAPFLSNKKSQVWYDKKPHKFLKLPTLALLYSLYNCTESFFRQRES